MAQLDKATPNDWLDQTSKYMTSWNEQGQSLFQTSAQGMTKQAPAKSAATDAQPDGTQGLSMQVTEFFK